MLIGARTGLYFVLVVEVLKSCRDQGWDRGGVSECLLGQVGSDSVLYYKMSDKTNAFWANKTTTPCLCQNSTQPTLVSPHQPLEST